MPVRIDKNLALMYYRMNTSTRPTRVASIA